MRTTKGLTPEQIISHAIRNHIGLMDAVTPFVGSSKDKRYTTAARVRRFLNGKKGGKRFLDLFLKSHSWYEIEAAGQLVMPGSEVTKAIADNAIPILWLTKSSNKKAYSFWYNRLLREHPKAMALIRSGMRRAPESNGVNVEGKSPHHYFEVDTDEFGSGAA